MNSIFFKVQRIIVKKLIHYPLWEVKRSVLSRSHELVHVVFNSGKQRKHAKFHGFTRFVIVDWPKIMLTHENCGKKRTSNTTVLGGLCDSL